MDERGAAVRLTRYFDAPAAEVWAALTEFDSISRWLAPAAAIELRPGGAFELREFKISMAGRVRSVEGERVLELVWHPEGEEPSIVRFELTPHEGGTKLVLDHRRLDERACMAYAQTWTRALDRLERSLHAEAAR